MKREITGKEGAAFWSGMVGKYPGEGVKLVWGTALKDYVDDFTGKPIPAGGRCCAVSCWDENRGQSWAPWEENYLKIEK